MYRIDRPLLFCLCYRTPPESQGSESLRNPHPIPHQPGNPNPTRIPRFRKFPETNPTRILRFGKFTEPHPTPTRQNHVTPEIEISSSHGDGIYFEAHMQKHVLAHLPKPPFSGGGCGLAQHTYGVPLKELHNATSIFYNHPYSGWNPCVLRGTSCIT